MAEDSTRQGNFGDGMLRPSPNHGTQRLPNDDDDDSGILPSFLNTWPYHLNHLFLRMVIIIIIYLFYVALNPCTVLSASQLKGVTLHH